jgi:hypothetical protein
MLMLEKMRQTNQKSRLKAWHVGLLVFTLLAVFAALHFTGVIRLGARTTPQVGARTTPQVEARITPEPTLSLKISRPRSLGIADDIHHLHISEIEVYKKSDGTKLTLSCAEPCINPMGAHPGSEAVKAFDKDVDTTYHNRYEGQYDAAMPFYGTEDHFLHINIAGASNKNEIGRIKVVHKHPQTRRIVGVRMDLLSNGSSVWNASFSEEKEEYEFTVV